MANGQQSLVRLTCIALLAVGLISARAVQATIQPPTDVTYNSAVPSVLPPQPRIDLTDIMAPAPFEPPPPPAEPAEQPDTTTVYRVCRVTAYCDRGITASGVPSGVGQCAAPSYIPLGATVYIPALDQTFVVTDRTHRRFRQSTVDIFNSSKAQCRKFGRKFLECEFTLPAGTQDG